MSVKSSKIGMDANFKTELRQSQFSKAELPKGVLLMLNLPFLRQAYKVCQDVEFCVRQYSCLLINAVCNFSLRSASRLAALP